MSKLEACLCCSLCHTLILPPVIMMQCCSTPTALKNISKTAAAITDALSWCLQLAQACETSSYKVCEGLHGFLNSCVVAAGSGAT